MGEFFHAVSDTALGAALRNSRIGFPVVEIFHLLGLAVLMGSILMVNLRFLGLAMRRESPAEVAADFAPWTLRALLVMAASGVLLFLAKAGDIWETDRGVFAWKMALIAASVVFHYAVTRRVARGDGAAVRAMAALAAIAMWFGAAVYGLSIEFL